MYTQRYITMYDEENKKLDKNRNVNRNYVITCLHVCFLCL